MTNQNKELINVAIVFLDKFATNDYTISDDKVVYNKNLRIPNDKSIIDMDLSAIEVNGSVKVGSDEKLKFDNLPKAKLYWGAGVDSIDFGDAKVKDLKEKGFPKKVCNDYSKRQVRGFFSKFGFCSKN